MRREPFLGARQVVTSHFYQSVEQLFVRQAMRRTINISQLLKKSFISLSAKLRKYKTDKSEACMQCT